ncbi:MAG: helicase C-terminal domain-containing protein [Gemmatimonadaceae bacterium]
MTSRRLRAGAHVAEPSPTSAIRNPQSRSRISKSAAAAMRAAITLAGGREVCFVAQLDEEGCVCAARVVSRGDVRSVIALPGVAERGEMLLHNHPTGELDPSDADLDVAARFHDGGVGFGIIDNDARRLYVVVEVPQDASVTALNVHEVTAALGPGGPIARELPQYEDRPTQRDMAAAVTQLYNGGGIGLLEAGTGVGKSLGYLVPALRWAVANKERTVVSTNTINLQEQLVGKDLPFLESALDDQPVRYALLKGWRNYVCLARLETAGAAGGLFEPALTSELEGLKAWAARTTDGSLQDLATPPRSEVWDEVAAEPDLCGRLKCAHFDTCFLFTARRVAAQADVIVVNHHLLMSDLAVRRAQQNWSDAAVLPAYRRLVIDEAHHVEDAAASHLGTTVTRRALVRLLNRLDRRGKGLLPALSLRLAAQRDLLSTASLDLVRARLEPSVAAAREKGALVFDVLEMMLRERGETVMRLTDEFASHPVWEAGLRAALEDVLGAISMLRDGLQLVRERLEADSARSEAVAPLLAEMRGVIRRLEALGDGLQRTLEPPAKAEPSVRWLELKGRDNNVAATAVPLDLAPILREDLFRRVQTAVLTSATLADDEGFRYLASRLGLDDDTLSPTTGIYASPFEYPRQAILAVPTDIAAPNTDAPAHLDAVVRMAIDVADASDGGIFVLFTSHRDVRLTATALRAQGVERRWPLLVHGDDGRDALLRRFRDSGRAVLLGTASFWEGIDVPGRALRGLVLAKLPFRVPTEPLTAAHCEEIEKRGGDAFRDYMLPNAALRLKQGFGRLIRTATDHGVVVLCDPRVVTKSYGRGLLSGLPPARRIAGPWARLLEEIRAFYARER